MTALQANKAPEAPALGMPVREKLPPSLGSACQWMSQQLDRFYLTSGKRYSHETVDPARKIRDHESDRSCILPRSVIGIPIPVVPTILTHLSFHLSANRELSQHVEQ